MDRDTARICAFLLNMAILIVFVIFVVQSAGYIRQVLHIG